MKIVNNTAFATDLLSEQKAKAKRWRAAFFAVMALFIVTAGALALVLWHI